MVSNDGETKETLELILLKIGFSLNIAVWLIFSQYTYLESKTQGVGSSKSIRRIMRRQLPLQELENARETEGKRLFSSIFTHKLAL